MELIHCQAELSASLSLITPALQTLIFTSGLLFPRVPPNQLLRWIIIPGILQIDRQRKGAAMIKVRQSAVIHKPVSEVFRFVTDIDRFNLWVTGAVENKLTSSGDFGVGSTFDQIGEFMNKRLDLKIEVTRFDLDKVFGYRTDSWPGPIRNGLLFFSGR